MLIPLLTLSSGSAFPFPTLPMNILVAILSPQTFYRYIDKVEGHHYTILMSLFEGIKITVCYSEMCILVFYKHRLA